MKTIARLSRILVKSFAVLSLVLVAGVAGVGVAMFIAYHEVDGVAHRSVFARPVVEADQIVTPRLISVSGLSRWQGQAISMNVDASLAANRFVAAGSSDQAQYTYADYRPNATASISSVSQVPPPLVAQPGEAAPAETSAASGLTDPESHYIVDARTGRVIGIDGTAGALAEARQQRQQPVVSASRSELKVRAALPVDAVADSDLPPPHPDRYPAVRRAMPVDPSAEADVAAAQPFDVANELADDNRPVARAQPVTISQPVKSQRRLFSFP